MQKAVIEAIKSKRASQMKSADNGSDGDLDGEQYGDHKDDELAPPSAHGAMLSDMGKSDQEAHQGPDTRDADKQNINMNAGNKGINKHEVNKNSKDMFTNTKVNMDKAANHNVGKMISGNGNKPKDDKLGVEPQIAARKQGGPVTKGNFFKGIRDKIAMGNKVKSDMMQSDSAATNVGANDTESPDDSSVQPDFDAPNSRLNAGVGDEASPSGSSSNGKVGLAAARAKMRAKMDKMAK